MPHSKEQTQKWSASGRIGSINLAIFAIPNTLERGGGGGEQK